MLFAEDFTMKEFIEDACKENGITFQDKYGRPELALPTGYMEPGVVLPVRQFEADVSLAGAICMTADLFNAEKFERAMVEYSGHSQFDAHLMTLKTQDRLNDIAEKVERQYPNEVFLDNVATQKERNQIRVREAVELTKDRHSQARTKTNGKDKNIER